MRQRQTLTYPRANPRCANAAPASSRNGSKAIPATVGGLVEEGGRVGEMGEGMGEEGGLEARGGMWLARQGCVLLVSPGFYLLALAQPIWAQPFGEPGLFPGVSRSKVDGCVTQMFHVNLRMVG